MNGEKYELYGTAFLAVFGLSLYFILIPQFGLYGACWATVAVFMMDLSLKLFFIRRVMGQNARQASDKLTRLRKQVISGL